MTPGRTDLLVRSRGPAASLLVLLWLAPSLRAGDPVEFNRDVLPILSDRCFHCHGPDEQSRKARLRLDQADGPQGAYRERRGTWPIKPGSLDDSELWYRITAEDEAEAMPPAGSHKPPLDQAQRDVLRQWILDGAPYETHWAFVPPVAPAVPDVADAAWCRDPIDRFVLARLEAGGLTPSAAADRRALIRRVTLDLTGLPPTRDEIHAFLADESPDAYERLVDRLLARPQYGEHMTKYWLDLVRFADTNGVHHDHFRDASPYRDWVIRAFNDDLPYDRFVTDQIAGDLHEDPTTDALVASGFNRLHLIIDYGTALPEESLTRNVIDRVTAFGTAFLGLTVQCAVCHDHKYDPIRQRDFYQLFAFFNNLDAAPETGPRSGPDFLRGLQPPYLEFPTPEQTAELERLDAELATTAERLAAVEQAVAAAADDAARKAELEAEQKQVQQRQGELNQQRQDVQARVPGAMIMKERADPRPAHVLIRGNYETPGEEVSRDTPAFLPPLPPADGPRTRMDLARWLVAPGHPLTARVAVNRFWQQFFGVGLVKTSEDFGAQGERPSHPALLDHLAVSFVESGWDIKALVRRIVLSATYRQSSVAPPEAFARDPDNRRLARGSRFRMDSEMIRDQVLATSGLLSPIMYGRSVKPPQPPGIWKAVTLPDSYPRVFEADTGEAARRRSLYTFWKRGLPPPQMTILNAPDRESCIARRERTNTPLQALLLMNEGEFLKAARRLAATALAAGSSDAARLAFLYETITSRLPEEVDLHTLQTSLQDLRAMYRAEPALARQLEETTRGDGASAVADAELAAWTVLTSAIYNLDVTKTRE